MNFQLAKTVRGLLPRLRSLAAVSSAATAQDISDRICRRTRRFPRSTQPIPYDNILPAAAEAAQGAADLQQYRSRSRDFPDRRRQAIALVSRRGDLENEAARVYASAFSEDELKAIAEFYNTEAGKKLLSERSDRGA
jgi:hypothetical protein